MRGQGGGVRWNNECGESHLLLPARMAGMKIFGKIMRRVNRIFVHCARIALKALPFRQDVILFESMPELGGSPRMIHDELRRRGLDKRYRLVWAVDAAFKAPEAFACLPFYGDLGLRAAIRREITLAKAKAIVDSNRFVHKLKKSTYRMFTWHGGILKNSGWYLAHLGEVDCCLGLSPNMHEAERKLFPGKIPRFVYLGYPANDPLFDPVDLYVRGFWQKLTGRPDRFAKIIGWMPTYRQHRIDLRLNPGTTVFPFGVPLLRTHADFSRLNNLLRQENTLLAIQMHHAQADNFPREPWSNIVIIDPAMKADMDISNACLMQGFDALVTDYSGVYQEFGLLDRPIAISVDDYESYAQKPGFALGFFEWIKGEYLKTPGDLNRFVKNVAAGRDPAREERRAAMRRIHLHADNHSTRRVTDLLCAEAGLGMDARNGGK